MPDFRFDPISHKWVAIASNRHARPMEFVPLGDKMNAAVRCPFCGGHEAETPAQIEIWNEADQPIATDDTSLAWQTRVVPNKFPAFPANKLVSPYETTVLGDDEEDLGPYQQSRLPGVQELIIPSPRHVLSLCELTEAEIEIAFAACQHRIAKLAQRREVVHAMLFLNCRSAAGASLAHSHFQLIGSPIVSPAMAARVQRNREHYEKTGVSLVASILDWELQRKARIVHETEHFVMLCPFASRVPYQVWIVPRNPTNDFRQISAGQRTELALLCKQLTGQLDEVLNGSAYNLLLHQAPFEQNEHDCWYVELMPRLTRAAGLEWGTDIWINPVSPENAAERIRATAAKTENNEVA